MARRRSSKRPYGQEPAEMDIPALLAGGPGSRVEIGPGGEEYFVATPRPSDKTYICPACNQEIPPRTPHRVAWAKDGLFGPEQAAAERRHWHTHCWNTFGKS